MDILNVDLIKKLESNITRKLNKQDDIIDIRNFYGVFIANYENKFINKFVICKEVGLEMPRLKEFFIGEIIDYSKFRIGCWRRMETHFSNILNVMYFSIPLVNILGKHHKDGKVNNKDLAYLYAIVNEYIKKNPEFVNQLIENEKMR